MKLDLGTWPRRGLDTLAAGALVLGTVAVSDNLAFGVLALAAGTVLAIVVREREAQPAQTLLRALASLAKGRLPGEAPEVARAPLEAIHGRLQDAHERTERARARLADLTERVRERVAEATRRAEGQSEAVEGAASLFLDVNSSIRDVSQEIQNLARSNEETAASIAQMGGAIEQVAVSALTLRETVESSTASIHEMGASIQRVAERSDEVQQVAEETAAATTQMDRAIHEVGEHVRGATSLTRRVTEHAQAGSHAVGVTIQGIDAIREQTLAAKHALEGLADRVGEVGEIATFIGTISDETNLLSLNAAIIAAQAGEHGKAFAVVADQVKTLSHRTSASAKQIGEVVRGVQAESENAVRAMAAGIESVEEGVERSRVAGAALAVILAAADEASGQVAEISRATEEQALNSKHVASAAQRVSEHVLHISGAMGEQSSAAEGLLSNVTSYLDMSRHIASAMDEQKVTARYIMDNSQAITNLIARIQASTASHEAASAKVAERFERLLDTAQETAALLQQLGSGIELAARADGAERPHETAAAEASAPPEAASGDGDTP